MKYLCFCSFNGRAYEGFQRQTSKKTIQGTIEEKLSAICGEKTLIHGVGRTDSGVHATAYAFSFESKKKLNEKAFLFGLDSLLPSDIHVYSIREVDDSFDARHSCRGKTYEYRIDYGEKDPLLVGLITHIADPRFNPALFEDALQCFIGSHDFRNFTTKKEDKDDFKRTIESIDAKVDEERKKITVRFKANGFMTYQIRLMVGAALKVAIGKLSPEDIAEKLKEGPRKIVPFKAPAEGLYLIEVDYGESF